MVLEKFMSWLMASLIAALGLRAFRPNRPPHRLWPFSDRSWRLRQRAMTTFFLMGWLIVTVFVWAGS